MAASTQTIQKMYIAYFGRPADTIGLQYWADKTEAQIIAGFSASSESQALFGNQGSAAKVNAIYNNLFARDAEPAGLQYWVQKLESGEVSQAEAMYTILNNAGAGDSTAVANKLAAAEAFTAQIDTTPEILGYSGANAAQSAREWLGKVNANASSLEAAKASAATAVAEAASASAGDSGKTFTLTTGIDSLTGTAGGDTFNATETAAAGKVLGGLDVIDGGAGTDTLNVDNSQAAAAFSFAGATIKNVENINVTTNGNFGGLDISGIAGLTTFKGTAADTAATTLTAANTTAVNLTLATTSNSTVTGGSSVSVTKGAAAAGTLGVAGKGLTDVTIKGGAGAVTINNQQDSVAATADKGVTLKSVTLAGVDANTGIGGEGLESVTVKGATTATRTVTISNAKVDHDLTVNVDGAGYKADGTAVQAVVVDAAAKAITVNATGSKSSLALTGSTAAKTVNITGSADLTLAALASATTIDGSAATGALTLGTLNAATVAAKTGSGNDSLTLSATAKASVDTGAGNDTVTLASALFEGSTINLGAGNDRLLDGGVAGTVKASTATAVTVIDAGDGVDTVAAALINAGNAAQFKNFEALDISEAANLDVALMTGSTITGLTLTGGANGATLNNVAAGVGLSVSGDNTGTSTINVKDAAIGTADSFAVKFDGAAVTGAAATAANVKAGTVVVEGVETVSIASTGAANTWNSIALTDAKLQTVTVSGDKNLDLTFVGTNGTNVGTATAGGAVKLIDGSAATGKLSINTTNVVADDKAGVGLTVNGGSANDIITLDQKATVVAGAGDDTIVSAAAGGTFTGGAGKDVFNVKAAVGNVTTITDFVVGTDKLMFGDHGTETFTATKVNISAATNLTDALNLAAAGDGSTNTAITWFQYGADTYVVADATAGATFTPATDVVVKLTGLVDLSTQTVADFAFA
jgi:S-layer protein